LCVWFAQEREAEEKNFREKRGKKQLFVVFSHTRTAAQQITTITYHYHRETERERDGETERQRVFVVVVAKKKKTTTGFERERSDAREKTKRTVSVWGNSI